MELPDHQRQKILELLTKQLEEHSNSSTKQWFENYLKGAIEYRGLKTPLVSSLVKKWYQANQLQNYTLQEQLALCSDLIASNYTEDKFAGTIYIQKFLLGKINYQELLAQSNWFFAQGYFFDWSTTDWFCTRVLDSTIINYGLDAAQIVADWRYSPNLWQRRSAIVSFRHASSQAKYHDLIATIIEDLVIEQKRFIQTGIGWVLCDLSKSFPVLAEALFRKHLSNFEREVIDRHSKYLSCHQELKQLIRVKSKE